MVHCGICCVHRKRKKKSKIKFVEYLYTYEKSNNKINKFSAHIIGVGRFQENYQLANISEKQNNQFRSKETVFLGGKSEKSDFLVHRQSRNGQIPPPPPLANFPKQLQVRKIPPPLPTSPYVTVKKPGREGGAKAAKT